MPQLVVDLSNVSLSELAAATGNLDFGGYKGVNVADPAANQDAATKKYHEDNKYTDAEAVTAMGVKADTNPLHHDKTIIDAVHVRDNATGFWPVPNATVYTLDWGADAQVEYDYGGLFNTGASSRITIQKAGLYLLFTNVVFTANATGSYRCTYVYVNGVLKKYECNAFALIARDFNQTCLTSLKVNANDYIEIKVYQDSGGVLNVVARVIYDGLWAFRSR